MSGEQGFVLAPVDEGHEYLASAYGTLRFAPGKVRAEDVGKRVYVIDEVLVPESDEVRAARDKHAPKVPTWPPKTRRAWMAYLWGLSHDYWCECWDCQQWFAAAYMPQLLREIAEGGQS